MRHVAVGVYLLRVSLLVLATAILLPAQGNRASITGMVTDPSGAVITNVEVSAKNLDTGAETRTLTNKDGIYSILNLFPGKYSLTFRKAGFQSVKLPSIT